MKALSNPGEIIQRMVKDLKRELKEIRNNKSSSIGERWKLK
jgi:hypothetical protein